MNRRKLRWHDQSSKRRNDELHDSECAALEFFSVGGYGLSIRGPAFADIQVDYQWWNTPRDQRKTKNAYRRAGKIERLRKEAQRRQLWFEWTESTTKCEYWRWNTHDRHEKSQDMPSLPLMNSWGQSDRKCNFRPNLAEKWNVRSWSVSMKTNASGAWKRLKQVWGCRWQVKVKNEAAN